MKKGRIVKRMLLLITAIIMMVCSATACQPTPDEIVVVNKAGDDLEQRILSTEIPAPLDIKDKHYSDTLSRDNVTVNIDAEISIPDVNEYPVYETQQIIFEQEHVDLAIKTFFGDSTIYNYNSRTKEAVERELIIWKKELSIRKRGETPPDDDRPIEVQIEELQSRISKLTQEYENAPESPTGTTDANTTLQENERGNELHLFSILPSGNTSNLSISNTVADSSQPIIGSSDMMFIVDQQGKNKFVTNPYSGEKLSHIDITYESAYKLAADTLALMGIDNVVLYADSIANFHDNSMAHEIHSSDKIIETDTQAYYFIFTRSFNGIPVTLVEEKNTGLSSDNVVQIQYDQYLPPEKIEIAVNDLGVVYFNWRDSKTNIKTLNNNVQLLDFEKILSRFESLIFQKNFSQENAELIIDIVEIKLGYFHIPVKDEKDEYMLIPVWDFIGKSIKNTSWGEEFAKEKLYSFVTINAVDGTNIDRTLGY